MVHGEPEAWRRPESMRSLYRSTWYFFRCAQVTTQISGQVCRVMFARGDIEPQNLHLWRCWPTASGRPLCVSYRHCDLANRKGRVAIVRERFPEASGSSPATAAGAHRRCSCRPDSTSPNEFLVWRVLASRLQPIDRDSYRLLISVAYRIPASQRASSEQSGSSFNVCRSSTPDCQRYTRTNVRKRLRRQRSGSTTLCRACQQLIRAAALQSDPSVLLDGLESNRTRHRSRPRI